MLWSGVGIVKPDNATAEVTLTAVSGLDGVDVPTARGHVGRYEIEAAIGAGAMGVVYRARDPKLGRAVAIKLLRASSAGSSSSARLLREAQAMALVRHPNVVPIFDVGPADDAVFLAMPLIEGGTLKQWLGARARPCNEILDRFIAAGRGLAAAHAAGLVHRDFKPANVLLGAAGEVQVADFGLACLAGEEEPPRRSLSPGISDTLTNSGDVLGTPAYMAPEQLRGRTSDARADQFSFCVALWEGLYDQRPFVPPAAGAAAPIRAWLDAITRTPTPPRRGDRPTWLGPMIARGLHPDPERRWPSLEALLDALTARRAPRYRLRWLAGGLAAAGIAVAIVVAIVTRPADPEAPPPRPEPPPRSAPSYHIEPLPHRGDIRDAAISPDGRQLALIADHTLVLRGAGSDAPERVLIDRGIGDELIGWSPDSKRLVVGTVPTIAGKLESQVIDAVDGTTIFKLPAVGMAVFLSSNEVAVADYRQHSIEVFQVDARAAVTTCKVPGDYTFLVRIIGFPNGTMIAETVGGESHALTILGRNCRVRATFSAEPFESVAATDTGTVIVLVPREGFRELLEVSLDGVVLSRRRLIGDVWSVLKRIGDTDYVLTRTRKTRLDRVHQGVPQLQLVVDGRASFTLAPDGDVLAWVELVGPDRTAGRLRLSTLAELRARGGAILSDNARMAGWSPDGSRLAVLVDEPAAANAKLPLTTPDGASPQIVVIDRAGNMLRRLPLDHLARAAAPVWLNDHRIAAQVDDRTTYRWFDLDTEEQDDVVGRQYGSTYWMTRSPRDGTLAMWRMGLPGKIDARTRRLYLKAIDGRELPLPVDDAVAHFLVPSWTPRGELLVRSLETGAVSLVAPDTGALTQIAQLPWTPQDEVYDDHLMTLPDGELLAVEMELTIRVAAVRRDDEPNPPRRRPSPGGPL